MTTKNLAEVKKNVQDLLNQIVILTSDLGLKPLQVVEVYDYKKQFLTQTRLAEKVHDRMSGGEESDLLNYSGGKLEPVNDTEVYLYCVRDYAKRVLNGDVEAAAYNEDKYYDSTC